MVAAVDGLFIVDTTTIAAGELASGSVAVQVCFCANWIFSYSLLRLQITPRSIVLVGTMDEETGEQQIALIDVNSNFPLVAASIVDPYIALMTQSGELLLYKWEIEPELGLNQVWIFVLFVFYKRLLRFESTE